MLIWKSENQIFLYDEIKLQKEKQKADIIYLLKTNLLLYS